MIIAGEVLVVSEPFLEKLMHPTTIVSGYYRAKEDALEVLSQISRKLDINNREEVLAVIDACLGTKFVTRWGKLMTELAFDAVKTVMRDVDGQREIDFKRYAHVEKIPGGEIEECRVLDGIMVNKDLPHPKMRRIIQNPRIVLLDSPLEYKKGENQTSVEITTPEHFQELLKMEEEEIEKVRAC